MMNIKNQTVYAYILAFVGIIFFSSKAIIVKMAYNYEVDTVSMLALRMLFALPVYLIIAVVSTWRIKEKNTNGKDYILLVVLGFMGYYMASFFDFKGLQYLSASLERLILFIYPTMVLMLSAIFFKTMPTKGQIMAVAITYIGVFLAFYNYGHSSSNNLLLGSAFIVLSALTYAFYLVGTGKLIPKFGIWRFTSYAMIVSTIGVLIHFNIKNTNSLWNYPMEVYQLSATMSIVCTIIPSILIAEAIRIIGSSNVAVLGSIGPISTIIMAVIFLNEQITIYQIIGTVVVIMGISMLGRKKKVPVIERAKM